MKGGPWFGMKEMFLPSIPLDGTMLVRWSRASERKKLWQEFQDYAIIIWNNVLKDVEKNVYIWCNMLNCACTEVSQNWWMFHMCIHVHIIVIQSYPNIVWWNISSSCFHQITSTSTSFSLVHFVVTCKGNTWYICLEENKTCRKLACTTCRQKYFISYYTLSGRFPPNFPQ